MVQLATTGQIFVIFDIWVSCVYWTMHHCDSCNTDTTQTQPHQISNIHRTKKKTTNVVIQQHSRKLLMMDILISETCWVHQKWNKIASDIKLVFYSSLIDIWVFLENLSRELKFHYNLTRITGTLHEDRYTFMIISGSLILRIRNIADLKVVEKSRHTL